MVNMERIKAIVCGIFLFILVSTPHLVIGDNWDTIYNKWKPYILDSEKSKYYAKEKGEDLGWKEAPFLQGFAYGYRASGDKLWLDRLIVHFDVMVNRLTQNPEIWDNYLGWYHVNDWYTTDNKTQFDFIVSEGLILHPITLFIESVKNDPALHAEYLNKANSYLELIENALIPKWDARRCWREIDDSSGIYTFQDNPSHRRQDMSLPHNQYGEMAKVMLILYRITGKSEYFNKATRMCRFLKKSMILTNDHYEWHYWDPAGPWDYKTDGSLKHPIFDEHGSYRDLDIELIVEAYRMGIVFDDIDMERTINTAKKIWNDATFTALGWVDEAEKSETEIKYLNESPSWGWIKRTPLYLWIDKTSNVYTIFTSQLPDAEEGVTYNFSLQALNGIKPYTWTIAIGNLPMGLDLSGEGVISGTPTEAGSFDFTIKVTDNENKTATRGFTLKVKADVAPTLVDVQLIKLTTVKVIFSENMEKSSAENLTNYNITPSISIYNATLYNNMVELTTSNHTPGESYQLCVSNVMDNGPNKKPIAPNSCFEYTAVNDIEIEGESGEISAPMSIDYDGNASSEAYISTATSYQGSARYTFNVVSAKNYAFTARVIAPGDGYNSFFYKIDNGETHIWDIVNMPTNWNWVGMSVRGNGTYNKPEIDTLYQYLSVGEHVLEILGRESNTKLDKICICFEKDNILGIKEKEIGIKGNFFLQNYPNPFNPETMIRYSIPRPSHVQIKIYNQSGQLVQSLMDGLRQAGFHTISWNGKDQHGKPAASGLYFCQVKAEKMVCTKKMLLIR